MNPLHFIDSPSVCIKFMKYPYLATPVRTITPFLRNTSARDARALDRGPEGS